MNDDRLLLDVRTWLKDEEVVVPDPKEAGRQVAAQLPQTRQLRRKWWPLPAFKSASIPPPTIPTTEYKPPPIPATNGQSATITGRTQSMFSPAKAITAGALVFAIGGVLLIAQPFDRQALVPPGAEADFAPAVEVSGRFRTGPGDTLVEEGDPQVLPGIRYVFTNANGSVVASDPRLEGVLTFLTEELSFVGNGLETAEQLIAVCGADPECEEDDGLTLLFAAQSIENDGGAWRQRPFPKAFFAGAGDSNFHETDWVVEVYDGEGDYEGLAAVLTFGSELDDNLGPDDNILSRQEAFYGFILDARLIPPAPENASTR